MGLYVPAARLIAAWDRCSLGTELVCGFGIGHRAG